MVCWCFCTGAGDRPHLSYAKMIAVAAPSRSPYSILDFYAFADLPRVIHHATSTNRLYCSVVAWKYLKIVKTTQNTHTPSNFKRTVKTTRTAIMVRLNTMALWTCQNTESWSNFLHGPVGTYNNAGKAWLSLNCTKNHLLPYISH